MRNLRSRLDRLVRPLGIRAVAEGGLIHVTGLRISEATGGSAYADNEAELAMLIVQELAHRLGPERGEGDGILL